MQDIQGHGFITYKLIPEDPDKYFDGNGLGRYCTYATHNPGLDQLALEGKDILKL
jgi:hypothetical protein